MKEINQIIDELKRELAIRQRIFPVWVKDRKINAEIAGHRIKCLQNAISILEDLESKIK